MDTCNEMTLISKKTISSMKLPTSIGTHIGLEGVCGVNGDGSSRYAKIYDYEYIYTYICM